MPKNGQDSGAELEHASAGHKLGQIIGDWYEEYFVLPLLQLVANQLALFLDSRFRTRPARSSPKVLWVDDEGNAVDYDFVMEIEGSDDSVGIPVAFIESFWRRGARHSKDKARDDTGKLQPMRDTYPTARFLGVVASGDFTQPARDLVQSRGIDLFWVPKSKLVSAFSHCGVVIDYADTMPEAEKATLADAAERALTPAVKHAAAEELRRLIGEPNLLNYVARVRAAIGALPQEISFVARRDSTPVVFVTVEEATHFLDAPSYDFDEPVETYVYHVTYTDGSDFERAVETLEQLRGLHRQIERLAAHVSSLS